MRLDEYQWSRNPRGLHVASIYQSPPDFSRYINPQMGWVKLIVAGTEYVDDVAVFLSHNITPIVRLYLGRYGAGPFDGYWQSITYAFARAGVKWFEFYNEPNLGVEWVDGFNPDWRNRDGVIVPLIENWLNFAEFVISLGCYPGFIPLAESNDTPYAAVRWMDAFLNYLLERHAERFRRILNSGFFLATHPYTLNHFYQEVPGGGGASARQPSQQRANEPGWHFEYPYDPISQRDDPGRTVGGGTALTPNGDPVGLIAMGQYFNERAAVMFGTQAVPVVGTEGGIWAFRGETFQQDNRYPPYNENSHAESTLALFEWSAQQAPAWFFGVTLWKEDEYYGNDGWIAPAIGKLASTPPILKQVPALEVMGTGMPTPTSTPPGPGPIHGQADYHMVILGIGLESRWFFDTAQAYYNTFRPIVTTLPELMQYIPPSQSLAATILTLPETAEVIETALRVRYPNLWLDMIIADDLERVRQLFVQRVRLNLRFG
ncbi:MAG: hypothetical protein SGI73_03335 [Chloroflexota bacterium]|nr:hypothetical protein [Chloroflexota bacterium]